MRWIVSLLPGLALLTACRGSLYPPQPDDSEADSDVSAPEDSAPPADSDEALEDDETEESPAEEEEEDEPDPAEGELELPSAVALPYTVVAGGGATKTLTVENVGDGPVTGITWAIEGDSTITLDAGPASIGAGGSATLTLRYAGATTERTAAATLRIATDGEDFTIPVYAATGSTSIGTGSWSTVTGPQGETLGRGYTVSLPTAPFPHSSGSYTDSTVHIFLPEGYRDWGRHDVVVHFHGHRATVSETLNTHKYREQLASSGANAILLVPQGPVNASDSNFGRLMTSGGLTAFVQQALITMYREGRITSPLSHDWTLTGHSGGYKAIAYNLASTTDSPSVVQVNLYDGLYAESSKYQRFVEDGGRLISNYTTSGGTYDDNVALRTTLDSLGVDVYSDPYFGRLRDAEAVIWFADSTHDNATRSYSAYSEALRWGSHRHVRGPRIELRSASIASGTATVRWLSPPEDGLEGFLVEARESTSWEEVARVGASASQATFAATGPVHVRVTPIVSGVEDPLSSDTARIDPSPKVLVVDGFDRTLGGSFAGLSHDFASLTGDATGRGVAYASNEAVIEGEVDLTDYDAVVWMLGDESTLDRPFASMERTLVKSYLSSGGRLVVSGSEVAYSLNGVDNSFLGQLGANYGTDDANSNRASGTGALSSIGSFNFGGSGASYAEDYPDTLGAAGGSTVLLKYDSGTNAAVGVSGKTVLVGFPLETIEDDAKRAQVLDALLDFVGG